MAFGFSPKYTQELPLESLTPEQFLALSIEAATQLGWDVGYKSGKGFIAYTSFSMTTGSEEVKVKIEVGQAVLKSESTGTQMVDWGKNKRNIESLINEIEELKTSLTPEELTQRYEDLKPALILNDDDNLTEQPATTKEKITSFFAIFVPVKGYFITPIIIDLNIAVFILMVLSGVDFLSPNTESLLRWGANFRPATLEGGWWRLITNCFLHIGILHLLMNMYALLYIGLLLEPYLGKARFLAAYLLTGIAASSSSLWFHDLTVSAGASGAIFGMYGVFLAMLTTNFIEKSARKNLLISISVFVAYNLMNGMKGGIDNSAHLGGLIAGLVIGYAYYPGLKSPQAMNLTVGAIAGMSVIILAACSFVYNKTPNDIAIYETKIKSFISMEAAALDVYNMPKTTPRDSLLAGIKDKGIYNWNQSIKLLDQVDKLNLPDVIYERDKKLHNYCVLRIKSYNLLYKTVSEGNEDKYRDSMIVYDNQIKAVIDSLKGK